MVFTYAKEYKIPEKPLFNLRFMPTILVRRNAKKRAQLRCDNLKQEGEPELVRQAGKLQYVERRCSSSEIVENI